MYDMNLTKEQEQAFTNAELNERRLFELWAKKMNITKYVLSPVESKARWDVAYKINDQWFICDIKSSNIPSDTLYPTSTNNGIGGHLIKKGKFEGLYKICMDKYKIEKDDYHGVITEHKCCFRPTFMIFFNDGIVATWNLDKEGVVWDNINKQIVNEGNFIKIKDKKTTMGSQETVDNIYYKPGLQMDKSMIIKL